MRAARSTMPAISPPMPRPGAIAASGWPSITTCPASPAPRRRSCIAPHRRRHEDDPRRRRRHHAAQPRAATSSPSSSARWRGCFPGRIDLGLGRAPGTDQITVRALRRTPDGGRQFPAGRARAAGLSRARAARPARSRPCRRRARDVPLWILGSSTFGAQLAAELGLPYAFASHFAPDLLHAGARDLPQPLQAVRAARTGPMRWSASTSSPPTPMPRRGGWRRRSRCRFANIFRGARGLSQPPIDDIETYWSPMEKAQADADARALHHRLAGDRPRRHRRAGRRDRGRRADDRLRRVRS